MAAEQKPRPKTSTKGKRRLTLMESYDPDRSAFSSSNLSGIADEIRTISESNRTEPPSGESPNETPGDSNSATPDIPSGQIVQPLGGSPSDSPLGEIDISPDDSPGISSSGESLGEILLLTSNQALLYECTKLLDGRFTTLSRISKTVNISVDTLRSCLRKLRKIGAVRWAVENISGQNGMRISAITIPYAVRGNRHILDDKLAGLDHTKLAINSNPDPTFHQVNHQVIHQVSHQDVHQVSCSSSIDLKKQLQILERELILEAYFEGFNIRSLGPYVDKFDSVEQWQNFFDKVNAAITAAADTAKPIQNPNGFLISRLREGSINPPPGFKSRVVLRQEVLNAELQAELDELRRLREQEAELRFELFREQLSEERQAELEAAAAARVTPRSPVGQERQMETYRNEVLREWFQEKG